jgi:hypothetical protein
MKRTCLVVLTAAGLLGSGTACTDTSRSGSDAPGVTLPAPASAGPAATERKSIERSSTKDLAATFRTNGIADPEHWAEVVTDHRPYPADDPALTKLRTVLERERADPALTQKIIDLLAP